MFDNRAHQTVNVPKKDLLSIVAEVKPGDLNGCKFCRKTILWNGGTWVHVNDKPECSDIRCLSKWTEETEEVLVGYTGLWNTKEVKESAPVAQCQRCNRRSTAYKFMNKWYTVMGSYGNDCPGAVATPIGEVAK